MNVDLLPFPQSLPHPFLLLHSHSTHFFHTRCSPPRQMQPESLGDAIRSSLDPGRALLLACSGAYSWLKFWHSAFLNILRGPNTFGHQAEEDASHESHMVLIKSLNSYKAFLKHLDTRSTTLFPGLPWMSRYQKNKTNLDFTEARDSEWQWHQLGHIQVCTSLQTDNNTSIRPLSFFTGRMPFLPPNQQRQSTEGNSIFT